MRDGPFPDGVRVQLGAGLGEEEGRRASYGGYGNGAVVRLQRIERRVFDSEQRLHSPTNAPWCLMRAEWVARR